MPHRRNAAAAREAIERTALEMFNQRGYHATSLDEIASALGLTRQAVLYHYGTKEHLLEAIVAPAMAHLDEALAAVEVEDPPTRDQQRETLAALVCSMATHREAVALITSFATDSAALRTVPHLIKTNEDVAHMLGGTHVDDDPQVRIRVLTAMAAVKGIMGSRLGVPLDTDDDREAVIGAALAALTS